MFSYLIARWRFKRAFAVDGEAFLYRKNPRAAAYRVSQDERQILLRTFRRKYWKYHLTLLGVYLTALIATIIAIMFLWNDVPDLAVEVLGYGSAALLLIAVLLIDRRLYALPLETLRDRQPALPARSWRQVNSDRMKTMSWSVLAIWSVVIIAFAWLTFPRGNFELWWPIVWALYFGFAIFSCGKAISGKLRTDKVQ